MYVYGLDHGELGKQFLVLTDCPQMCEVKSSSYSRQTSQDHGNNGDNNGETGETHGEVDLSCSNYGGFWFSKMDEIHTMRDMYMDEASIPMLVTMSQK